MGIYAQPIVENVTWVAGRALGSSDDVLYCPIYMGIERFADTLLTKRSDIMAFPLLSKQSHPWRIPNAKASGSWESVKAGGYSAPAVVNDYTVLRDMHDHVQDEVINYFNTLGWEGIRAGFPCQSSDGFYYPRCQYHRDITVSVDRTLSRAFPYAALKYQCSGADRGVLCDYSEFPPLAVDGQGNYLTKKTLLAQPNWVLYDITPTSAWVQWAVVAMLIVTVVSNLGSFVFLGYPFLKRLYLHCDMQLVGARARQIARGAVQHVITLHGLCISRRD